MALVATRSRRRLGQRPQHTMRAVVLAVILSTVHGSNHLTKPEDAVLVDLVPGQPGDKMHPLPPPSPQEYLEMRPHYAYTRYNLQSEAYMDWVRREIRPLNHKVERFAFTHDWEPFMRGNDAMLDAGETVVVVACSPERLPFVRRMRTQWRGPMALALFVPYHYESSAAARCRQRMLEYALHMLHEHGAPFAVSFLYANEEQLTLHCNINIHSTGLEPAWVDEIGLRRRFRGITNNYLAVYQDLYPTNQARNLGINMVETNAYVILVDADFVPSGKPGSLYASLKVDPLMLRLRRQWAEHGTREVLILPAFGRLRTSLRNSPMDSACFPETDDCWLYQKIEVPYTKAKLVEMVRAGDMESFYFTAYPEGYGCYHGHDTWLQTTEPYPATLTVECEPYIIALRDTMPPYDDRFRGYQADKVSFLQHVKELGTKFTVHPSAFIVHLPHARSYSVDDISLQMPAKYDKWTVPRALLAISVGEAAAEHARKTFVRDGLDERAALEEAQRVGRAKEKEVIAHWLAALPVKKAAIRIKSHLDTRHSSGSGHAQL